MKIRLYREKIMLIRGGHGRTIKLRLTEYNGGQIMYYVRNRKQMGRWTMADHLCWWWVLQIGSRRWEGQEHIRSFQEVK